MSNCFKTVSEIIHELPALNTYLLNAGNYFAHLPKIDGISFETLEEHVNLVNQYFQKLVAVHQLDRSGIFSLPFHRIIPLGMARCPRAYNKP